MALKSPVPVERYWALITCSAFGKQAFPLCKEIETIAVNDPDRLVRTRAAEFLGLTGAADPMPILWDVLKPCSDPVEVNLILNTVVLLRDGAGVDVKQSAVEGAAWTKLGGLVAQRLDYLNGGTGEAP